MVDISAEVTVVLERVGRHLGACGWVYGSNRDGSASEAVEKPFLCSCLVVVDQAVVYPKSDGEWGAYGRTAHERVVGCVGKCCLHFGQGDVFGYGAFLAFDVGGLDTCVENVSLGQVACCGA